MMRLFLTIISSFVLAFQLSAEGTLEFKVDLSPVGSFVAKSDQVSGKVKVSPAGALVASEISVALSSFKTGIGLRDQHMKDKYFEAPKFPTALGKIASGKDGKFEGSLNIRSVEQKIAGTYKTEGANVVLSFKTKMSDYKIQKAIYMGVGAEDEVSVTATVPSEKVSAAPVVAAPAPAVPAPAPVITPAEKPTALIGSSPVPPATEKK